ncbi:MAG: hypothetical protein ACHBN1_06570 [Heteroscytonema crispum UTEX LB 1556]
MSQSSNKLNRILTQAFGVLLGIAIACWILRGLGILTYIAGGVIWLLFFGAVAIGILGYVQKTWWRF